jgi:hypothetical protein
LDMLWKSVGLARLYRPRGRWGRLLPDGKTGEKGMISEQISAKSSVGGRRAVSSCRMLGARGKARAAGMRASSRAELVLEEGAAALCPGPIPSRAAAPVSLGLRRRSQLTRAHLAVAGHGQASCPTCVGVRGLDGVPCSYQYLGK